MQKILKIKICGMKFPQNITEVATLNPDFLGFIFYPYSKRCVTQETFKDLDIHVKKIGVFVNQSSNYIEEQIEKYKLFGIQLHGNESPKFCKKIKRKTTLLKALQINDAFDFSILNDYEDCVDYFLFDTKSNQNNLKGGTGEKFNWQLLENYQLNKPFFLSGGISLNELEEIQKFNHPKLVGLDLNSKFEEYAGYKNIDKLKSFITKIKENES